MYVSIFADWWISVSLKEQLDRRRAGFRETAPPEVLAVMDAATQKLVDSDLASKILGEGETLPEFELANVDGVVLAAADVNALIAWLGLVGDHVKKRILLRKPGPGLLDLRPQTLGVILPYQRKETVDLAAAIVEDAGTEFRGSFETLVRADVTP